MNSLQPKRNHLIVRDRHVHHGFVGGPPHRPPPSHRPHPRTDFRARKLLWEGRKLSPMVNRAEVVLLNGNWGGRVPRLVAGMHNLEELQVVQGPWGGARVQPPPRVAAPSPPIGEVDCDGNLSWLLNYKIHELPPVPDTGGGDGQANYDNAAPLLPSGKSPIYVSDGITKKLFDSSVRLAKVDENAFKQHHESGSYRLSNLKKPPFTYTELIEHALNEKGELTVSGIYQWITDHFPFYKQNDDRWKNSVRHNLSINPHFRKGSKAVHGAGHLWTIAQHEERKSWCIKQRMQQFMQKTANECNLTNDVVQLELDAATASILPDDHDEQCARKCFEMLDDNQQQNIEIEYVNVIDMTNELGDFLCPPVSKEEVAEECGLGDDYLITDLNPNALGLNLTDAEMINSENLYDDLSFHCYDLPNDS